MRFIRDDGDGDEDDYMEDFMDQENYENMISQQNALEGFHLHILENSLKMKVLFESLKFCKGSFFWFLFSEKNKLNKIKDTYNKFIELLEMKE